MTRVVNHGQCHFLRLTAFSTASESLCIADGNVCWNVVDPVHEFCWNVILARCLVKQVSEWIFVQNYQSGKPTSMRHSNDCRVKFLFLRCVWSLCNQSVNCNSDSLRALGRVPLMCSKLLLHEWLHELCSNQELQRLDLFLIWYVLPGDSFKSLVAPEALVLIRYLLEFDCRWAAVSIVEVLMDVQNRSTFIVERARHSIILLVCT